MPHLEVTAYITQYSWTLVTLLIIYSIISLLILPSIHGNLNIRTRLEREKDNLVKGKLGEKDRSTALLFLLLK